MRKITIKGVGKANVKPDFIVVSLTLNGKDMNYDTAIGLAENKITALKDALKAVGFAREDLKTKDFSVRTEYNNERDKNGSYRSVFAGYVCRHELSLSFGLDTVKLGKALNAIACSASNAEFHVQFTVKDKEAVSAALLENAVKDAKKRAETLARAAGVALGAIEDIEYHRTDGAIESPTRYAGNCALQAARAVEIEPEDIAASDCVTVTWEIL